MENQDKIKKMKKQKTVKQLEKEIKTLKANQEESMLEKVFMGACGYFMAKSLWGVNK